VPWIEWPEIERRLDSCDDLYFDAVSQMILPCWSRERTVLIGDAAYCPSLLAGEGAAFAMAGAYIVAAELERAGGAYTRA
jgi:2-polyprenyl-6-methoxyphenol hydroxylase-like FAD-dependent oxidoreductase